MPCCAESINMISEPPDASTARPANTHMKQLSSVAENMVLSSVMHHFPGHLPQSSSIIQLFMKSLTHEVLINLPVEVIEMMLRNVFKISLKAIANSEGRSRTLRSLTLLTTPLFLSDRHLQDAQEP